MPIFQYEPYQNRYGPSIAEVLQHQGDIQAAGALRAGDIQAATALQEGKLSNQMWSGLGNAIGAIPQELRAQQEQQLRQQALTMQNQVLQSGLADKQRQRDADAAFAKALAQTPLRDDGTYDIPGISKNLDPQYGPSATLQFEHLDKINTALQQQESKNRTQSQGAIASIIASGSSPTQAHTALVTMRKQGLIGDDTLQQGEQVIQANEPGQVEAFLRGFLPPQKPIEHDPTKAEIDPLTNKTIIAAVPKAPELKQAEGVEGPNHEPLSFNPDTGWFQTADGTVIRNPQIRAPKPPNSQTEKFMLDGKPVMGEFVPGASGTPGRYVYNGQDVTGRAQPIPPASVQVLNQTLAGGPRVSDTAKAISEYRIPPPSARTLATPAGEMLMTQVMSANPDYDATQFPTRQKMRQAFTSGPQSQTINSLNTAIGHLDQFTDVVKALDNGNFQPGNQAYNWLKSTFGDSAPTNFAGIRSIMSGELASAFKKSGATDQEITNVEQAISSKNSTKQLLDYVKTIALPALGSKVVSFDHQYRQVMGPNDPFKILLPESAQILQKYNIDPAHPTMGAGAGFAVTTPDGQRHTFPSQAALDAFKRAAGLP